VLESVERFFEHRASVVGEDPAHGPSRTVRVEAALGT
jgi:hypothetical protein